MPSIDDLSDDELEKVLKSRKERKRYRVREYDVDESDFKRMVGLKDKDKDDEDNDKDDEKDGKKVRKGYFS